MCNSFSAKITNSHYLFLQGFSRQFDVLESWVDKKVEKSWIQFHEKVQTLEFPISCNLNVPVLRFIAMQLFKRIISFQEKEGPSTPSLSTDVTAREKDILSYVGGAVVNKLSQRYANKSELLVLLLELKSEVGEAECGPSTLTATLDRGGLCFLKASFCDVLVQLENTFTDMFNNKFENIAKMAFNDRCQSELFNSFQAQFKEPGNTMLKQLFTDICSLYFTIRIHHKAKVTLEVKRGQKGLRKSLKCKEIAASKKT